MSAPGGEGEKSGLSIMEVAGNTVNIQLPSYLLKFAFLREAKGGWRGKLVLQTGRPGRRQRLISNGETQNEIEFPIQVDYNEEKSGVKKKGEEGSEDEIQEVVFLLGQLFDLFPGQGGGWQG